MATRGPRHDGTAGTTLPDVVPFELSPQTRLSWELGARVVATDDATRYGAWTCAETAWELAVFRVTSATAVVRVRTPVGRSRFYGATIGDLQSVLPALEASLQWQRVA